MSGLFDIKTMKVANRLRGLVTKNIAEKVEKCFQQCETCLGTGLSGINKNRGGFSWDGGFCEICKGSGYLGWEKSELLFLCEECEGTGKGKYVNTYGNECSFCDGEGVLDWVENIKGRK